MVKNNNKNSGLASSSLQIARRTGRPISRKHQYVRDALGDSQEYLNTAQQAMEIGTKAYLGYRALRTLLNTEMKIKQTAFPSSQNNAVSFNGLSYIAQGDGESNRDGQQIRAKYIRVHGIVSKHASASETVVRLIVFYDTEMDGVVATSAELLSGGITTVASINLQTASAKRRFQILWDQTFILTAYHPQEVFDFQRVLDMHIVYVGTSNDAVSAGKNNIILFGLSNEGTNVPTIDGICQLSFIDN